MSEILTRRVTRDKLQAALKTHELVKLMENLVLDVSETLPSTAALLSARASALELGVFGQQAQPVPDVRAGGFISIEQDAAGYIISIDMAQLVLAMESYLARQDAPAGPANDAEAVLAAQIFRS